MIAVENIEAVKGLSEEQRQKALRLRDQLEALESELWSILHQAQNKTTTVDLPKRGIGTAQAADLRARLGTFAEDWNRSEDAIHDF